MYYSGSMARLARLVIPGFPHHITQRGNRKQKTFFSKHDYEANIALVANACRQHKVEIWAYCLMPNHVHLIAVPESENALRSAIGEAHRRYTRKVNMRKDWKGYLWQGRFASSVMDDVYLLACADISSLILCVRVWLKHHKRIRGVALGLI